MIGCLGPCVDAAVTVGGLFYDGLLVDAAVDTLGRSLWPSGARLTINLELVRTRGI